MSPIPGEGDLVERIIKELRPSGSRVRVSVPALRLVLEDAFRRLEQELGAARSQMQPEHACEQAATSAVVPSAAMLPETLPGHWTTADGREMAMRYASEARERLGKGDMSDFALANAQFMASRNDLDLVVWQTAAKERIRWLSVQLALADAARSPSPLPTEQEVASSQSRPGYDECSLASADAEPSAPVREPTKAQLLVVRHVADNPGKFYGSWLDFHGFHQDVVQRAWMAGLIESPRLTPTRTWEVTGAGWLALAKAPSAAEET